MRRQKAIWAAVALAMAGVPTAEADDLKNMLQQKFQLAEIFEGAAYAAEKCPGLRVIEGNIMATADEAGVTDDDIYTPQWKLWEARGKANAQTGYEKDPAAWCENMWRFLGPEHPAMINHALLGK